ncbi:Glucose-6-phosphate isomerase [Salinispira pacifica]|uniref:Glucose-6-phosphate isomerase n=2 Tax=Salinispira pacifica TaxID=1307761 RepID=V5WCX9_9SPIO|nr:Glucose-6-phosphate isomerase [Salinispira pacifica]
MQRRLALVKIPGFEYSEAHSDPLRDFNEEIIMSEVQFRNFDETKAYKALQKLQAPSLSAVLDGKRVTSCNSSYELGKQETLHYNYAAKQVDNQILSVLQELSDEQQLIDKFRLIASGEYMNSGENRRVLHHLTRGQLAGSVSHEGRDLGAFYNEQNSRIADFAEEVHAGRITAENGKPFSTVVQVGIGGSDLGPRAMYLALKNHVNSSEGSGEAFRGRGEKLNARFISNVDPDDAADILREIDPSTTLFILVSKSGTTQETLTNEALVLDRLKHAGVKQPRKQIICVTSETSPLAKSSEYLDSFFIDDFIGGRYSSTSAVGGAVLSLAFGADVFREFLDGAHAADAAAMEAGILKNPALLDALIGIWERNFQGFPSTAVLPYSQAMSRFPAHLQQMDMESNGKHVNRDGEQLGYLTGPVIFGEPGTNGQHSFYQLLHQGTDIIPLQFIGFLNSQDGLDVNWEGSTSQQKLNANLAAQIIAFAKGKKDDNPNKTFQGERPSSLLYSKSLTPRVLGALLAHFENKVMFQGLVWNLNSFDQEGVQLGKVLTKQVLGDGELDPALQEFSALLGVRS